MKASVYKFFDADDCLLYVGHSGNVERRMNEHKASSLWHKLAVRSEVTHYPDIRAAQCAEREFIKSDLPKCNVVTNPAPDLRLIEKLKAEAVTEGPKYEGIDRSDIEPFLARLEDVRRRQRCLRSLESEAFEELKADGYRAGAVNKVIAAREAGDRREVLDLYREALGG